MSNGTAVTPSPSELLEPDGTSALRMALAATASAFRSTWRHSRAPLLTSTLLLGAQSVLPALQVVAVAQLVRVLAAGGPVDGRLVAALAAVIVVVGLQLPIGGLVTDTSQLIWSSQLSHLTAELAELAARLTPAQVADPAVGDAIKEARDSINGRAWFARSVLQAVGSVVTTVALTVAMWRLNPLAGAMALVALVPITVASAWIARRNIETFQPMALDRRHGDYHLDQLVYQRSAVELGTLGTAGRVAGLVRDRYASVARVLLTRARREVRAQLLAALVTVGLVGVALTSLALGSRGGAMAAAGAVGLISATSAVRSMGFSFGLIIREAPHSQLYDRFVRVVGQAQQQRVVADVDRIEVRDLSVRYPGAQATAVEGVSFTARKGELVALVGANGAGKSTTVNALLGVVHPEAGRVLVDGQDVAEWPLARRLSHFGLLNQDFGRYEMVVRDSLALARPDREWTDDELWAALEASGAAGLVRALPDGLDTQLGNQFGGEGLSSGQWQRLSLARIRLRGAGIWVLDEPTSAIDAEAEREIFTELQASKRERITIVVSHRAWTLKGMDRIHVFDRGRIVQSGTFAELIARPGRFAELFAEQELAAPDAPSGEG